MDDVCERASARIRDWHAHGASLANIGRLIRCSPSTVANVVHGRHCLSRDVAVRCLMVPDGPAMTRSETREPTASERAKLRTLHDAHGMSWSAIGKLFDAHPTTVADIAYDRRECSDARLLDRIGRYQIPEGLRVVRNARAALDGMAKSRIAAWHDRDGVSFADIAKMVGVNKSAIAKIYDGTTKRLRPKTVESVLSLPKRLVYVGPRKHDATEFVADVDRWRAAGITYRTMMFMMSGVTFGLLSNRHRRKNISQKAYDGWREGRDELDKIAKGRGRKA